MGFGRFTLVAPRMYDARFYLAVNLGPLHPQACAENVEGMAFR